MTWQIPGETIGVHVTSETFASKQFYACYLDSSAKWAVAQAGQRSIGVMQNTPASGEVAVVQVSGITKAFAGGTITAGQAVSINSAGKFIAATDNDYAVGVAHASAVANDIFPVRLTGGQGLYEASSPA